MENTRGSAQEDGQGKKDSLHCLSNKWELSDGDTLDFSRSKPIKFIGRANQHQAVVLSVNQFQISKVFLKDLFIRSVCGLDNRIPKHMVSVDEKYLRRCLELIHISALNSAQCNIATTLSSKSTGLLSDSLNAAGGYTCDSAGFVFDCPVVAEIGNVYSPAAQQPLGTVMGSKSMINILNNPLFHQLVALDSNANLKIMESTDVKRAKCYDFMNSPSGLSISSSHKLGNKTAISESHKFGSNSVHKRLVSISSTNSSCCDQSSSASATLSQGMLQCTWKGGIPHFVFSADDKKEVYVTKLQKVEPTNDKAPDYKYFFHLNKSGQKDHQTDNELALVGSMNVSKRFTLCPNNSKIMETEFILFGSNEVYDKEMCTSSHNHRKSKGGLSKKVVEVFRTGQPSKRRNLSILGGSSATLDSCPREPSWGGGNNFDALGGVISLETILPCNFELAAIVVKDHLPGNCQEEVGGWGMKFLKKSGVKQTTDFSEVSIPSDCCTRNTGDCTTSVNILIPAGLHGGSRTRDGGPSSLIERWRSGGHCDCGGWDLGCPLTVLKSISSKEDTLSKVHMQGEFRSFDLMPQGSKHYTPTLRMVNVHDGLYFIHFQQSLSALQSFSIAVALIHTWSPALQPNSVQELK
ncbi:DUF3527 domain protein [Quillaja saponaria]|uniref:DUF3527 domain protein n=1 Tax=Quillaja saponaria TaxID=32244 RepID=A0AAD7PHY7_QUISA|nr:DUF3527 domain protein [Quillaja saponaria]